MSTWTLFQSGGWDDSNNWTGAVPNGIDETADFLALNPGMLAYADVDLANLPSQTATLGTLNLQSSADGAYSLTGGTLIMATSGGNAHINASYSGAGVPLATTLDTPLTLNLSVATTITVTGASLYFNVQAEVTGTGSLTKDGDGVMTLGNGSNHWSGGAVVLAGKILSSGDNSLGHGAYSIGSNGTLDLCGTVQSIGALSGNGVVTNGDAGLAILRTAYVSDSVFQGSLTDGATGALAFIKEGAAKLTLSGGNNTYSGGTTVFEGTLAAGGENAIGPNGDVLIFSGATLDLGGFSQSIKGLFGEGVITNTVGATAFLNTNTASDFEYVGTILNGIGGLGLTKTGVGKLMLSGIGNTYAGGTQVLKGVLKGGASNAFGSGTMTISGSATLDLGGFNQAIGTLSGGGNVTNSGGVARTLTINTAVTGILNGVIADGAGGGAIALTKNGVGTTVLAIENYYSGATTINAGTLQLGNGGVTGGLNQNSTISIAAGASLAINGTFTVGNVISGNGSLVVNGGYALILNTNTYSGGTTINSGAALRVTEFSGLIFGSLGTGGVINNGVLDFDRGASPYVFGNSISGTGNLTNLNGYLTLTGANTYTGSTQVFAGALRAGVANAFGTNSEVIISPGATLDMGGFNQAIGRLRGDGVITSSGNAASRVLTVNNTGAATVFSGVISDGASGGTTGLIKTGLATLTLTGANTYSGTTTISAGTLQLGNGGATGTISASSAVTIGAGARLAFNHQLYFVSNLISGAGSVVVNGGTIQLNNNNSYSGGTTINAGTLVVANNGGGSSSLGTGAVVNNSELILIRTGAFTMANAISGSGLLTVVNGTAATLTGANTYTGTTRINVGTLQIGDGGAAGTLGSGNVLLDNPNISTLAFNRSDSIVVGNAISGAGGVKKLGGGVLTLTGANTYTGATEVVTGTLKGGAQNAFGANSAVNVSAGATLDLGGFDQAIGALSGSGFVNWTGAAPFLTLKTLTINSVVNSSFGGAIADIDSNHIINLVKTGAGTQTLTGINGYGGITDIQSGTLALAGAGSISATGLSQLLVHAGATFDISGISSASTAVSQLDLSGGQIVLGGKTLSVTQSNSTGAGTIVGSAGADGISFIHNSNTNLLNISALTFANWTDTTDTIALYGNVFSNIIMGSSHADNIDGGAGADTLNGGAGDDTLIGGDGADELDGGADIDTASYAALGTGNAISVTLNGATNAVVTVTGGNNDTVRNIENITSGAGNDTITGDSLANLLSGGAGADTLSGGNGDDTLVGGAVGAGFTNQLNGDAGSDTASYAGTNVQVYADLNTNAGFLGAAVVLTDLFNSIENVIGGGGGDTLNGNGGANRLDGGAGAVDDYLFGNAGNDTLIGGGHAVGSFNQLFGGADVDTADYSAETGRVFVDLRAPAGHIDNGLGFVLNDLMNSVENVIGGSGDDILVGTDADNNLLVGNAGTDLLFGFNGNDTLIGGGANVGQYNQLFGDLGNDTASYAGTTFGVYADLNVLAGWVKNSGGALILTDVYSQVENLTGGSVADTLVGDTSANILTGGAGADFLYANFDANSPTQHDAAVDTFVYANGSESTLGSGFDQIVNFTSGQDKLDFRALNITSASVTLSNNGGSWSIFANTDGVAGIGNSDLAILVQNVTFVMSDITFV